MASANAQAAHVLAVAASGGTIDSILPSDEQLRRFRAELVEHPDTLRNASTSIQELVNRWAHAIANSDTVMLNAMMVDRAEFAWLYYPGSRLSKPPYEAPPQLLWGQIMSQSDGGARRLLDRFSGGAFVVQSVTCAEPTDTTAVALVYSACTVRMRIRDGQVLENRLFGSIVEHRGRYKFLGYTNSL